MKQAHPTLLHALDLESCSQWPQQYVLPLELQAYQVSESEGTWFVVVKATGRIEYAGPGPISLSVSPAPF